MKLGLYRIAIDGVMRDIEGRDIEDAMLRIGHTVVDDYQVLVKPGPPEHDTDLMDLLVLVREALCHREVLQRRIDNYDWTEYDSRNCQVDPGAKSSIELKLQNEPSCDG